MKSSAVLENLRQVLATDEVALGEKLPSERDLTRRFECSRETVRRALRVLEEEQLVWRHVGQGTFRGRRPATAPLRENILIHASSVEEFVNARYLIEPVVAAEAARQATASDVARLAACVEAGRNGRDCFACQKADDLFHRTIAEVAKNSVLSSVLNFLSEGRSRANWQRQWDRTYRHLGLHAFQSEHSAQHQDIVDAIAEANPDRAEASMRHHMKTIVSAFQSVPGCSQ